MDQPNADKSSTYNDVNMHVDQPSADKSSDVVGHDTSTAYSPVDLHAIQRSISTSQAVALRTSAFSDVNMDQREWTGFGQVCAHPLSLQKASISF
jgi:hypothetical protein